MQKWVSSWSYNNINFGLLPTVISDETQRIFVKNNVNGEQVRLLFSNLYGIEPVKFEHVYISQLRDNESVDLDSLTKVTFKGSSSVTLQPGEIMYSDDISYKALAGSTIVVSTYVKDETVLTSGASFFHNPITKVINSIPGDYCRAKKFETHSQSDYIKISKSNKNKEFFYGLIQVDIAAKDDVKTIACFGDSITHQSRWTAPFTEKIYNKYPGKVSVINRGISGNRILHDASHEKGQGEIFGIAGIKRFEEDVFGRNTVDLVMILEGVNDIMHPYNGDAPRSEIVTDKELIAGLMKYADIAHKHKAKIIGCTIMPYKNFGGCWNDEQDKVRCAVNEWILNNNAYDGGLDYDSFTRDPENPKSLMKLYDCHDNLHPSEEGGRAIAEAINLDKIAAMLFD